MRRFKRAGIPMPKQVPLFWTRRDGGTAYYRPNHVTKYFITIPLFIQEFIKAGHPTAKAYLEYYVIHELCHVADRFNNTQNGVHGEPFHAIFVQVCPKRYWLFEQDYQENFEERIAEWGLEIPDNAFEGPRVRHLRFMQEGYTISTH